MKNIVIIFAFSFFIWAGIGFVLSQAIDSIYRIIICGILQIILVPNVTTIKIQSETKTQLKWLFSKKTIIF